MNHINGKIISLWEGQGTGDHDRGGPWFTVGFYFTELEAIEAVRTKGGWGSPGRVVQIEAIEMIGKSIPGNTRYYTFQEIEITSIDISKARERALAKLSAEDKKILGIT